MMLMARLAGVLEERIPSAALGPTPETEMSCWKSFSSSWLANPYRSIASSRTLRKVNSLALSPFLI